MNKIKNLLSTACMLVCVVVMYPALAQEPREQMVQNYGCEKLNDKEKQFSNQLCNPHKEAFCRQFTNSQRREAMMHMEKGGMMPNEAVHTVMEKNNMPMSGPCVPPYTSHK